MAAAEPDVSARAGRLGRDFVILETERIQSLDALDLLTWNEETRRDYDTPCTETVLFSV